MNDDDQHPRSELDPRRARGRRPPPSTRFDPRGRDAASSRVEGTRSWQREPEGSRGELMNRVIGRFILEVGIVIGTAGAGSLAHVGQGAFTGAREASLNVVGASSATVTGTAASTRALVKSPKSHSKRCSPFEVLAGNICLDKYEASVWRV